MCMISITLIAFFTFNIAVTAEINYEKRHWGNESNYKNCNLTGKKINSMILGTCKTCGYSTCSIYEGACSVDIEFNGNFTIFKNGDIILQKSVSSCRELNNISCSLSNREGLLCTKCKQGYGPPLYSNSLKCEKCNDKHSGWLWLLYLLLELIPLTIFFMLSIILNFHATAPPFSALVLYCQIFTILFRQSVYFKMSVRSYSNPAFIHIISVFISFWNLDVFRSIIPPFCVSSELTDLHDLLLEYAFTMFPLLLVVITYIGIELHARNVRPIVILWKPFHRLFHLRRSLDPRSSVIATFSTFISLSFSKLMFITFVITYPSYYDNGGNRTSISLVNPEITANYKSCYFPYYQRLLSTWYFIPLLIMSIIINIPTVLLLLYPIKCFRKLLSYCGPKKYHALYVFLDTFQGRYKDGTNGTRDYRAVSCISFILRIPVYYFLNDRHHIGNLTTYFKKLAFLLLITSYFYSIVQPCKMRYVNNIESILYGMAGMLLLYFGSVRAGGHQLAIKESSVYFNLNLVNILLFSMLPLCYSFYKHYFKCKRSSLRPQNDTSVPDRMVNPLNYAAIPCNFIL